MAFVDDPSSVSYTTLSTPIFILDLFALILLIALLITIHLSDNVHRHSVFINFICTWVLYSSIKTFADLAGFKLASLHNETQQLYTSNLTNLQQDTATAIWGSASHEVLELFNTTLQDVLWMITQFSTLNLVIHLWYTMKSAVQPNSRRAEKRRTAMLIITPYIFGLLPMVQLLSPTSSFAASWLVSLIEAVLIIMTLIWDVVLLIMFYRRRRILRTVRMESIMSLSLLTKLLVFSVFRLTFTTSFLITMDAGSGLALNDSINLFNINYIAQSLYPLLAFAIFGLKYDILQVWFPCMVKYPKGYGDKQSPDS